MKNLIFKMKAKLGYIIVFLLILGVLISQLKVIPSFGSIQTKVVVSVFILASVIGIFFLFKLWIGKSEENKISRTKQLIQTSSIIVAFSLAWLITISNFSEPEFIDEVTIANKTIYVYYENCFPPDSECECDDYGSLIYIKNNYLPMMHLVAKTNFYVGDVQIYDNELVAKAADICSKDLGKTKRIKQ